MKKPKITLDIAFRKDPIVSCDFCNSSNTFAYGSPVNKNVDICQRCVILLSEHAIENQRKSTKNKK